MSFSNPKHTVARWSVVGMEGMWAKMFDPPKETPDTPDRVAPSNPVPEVLAAAGFQNPPDIPHTVVLDLMHGVRLDTWDNRDRGMEFFLFKNPDSIGVTGDEFPSATLRVPQGVVFHCETDGQGPPPHTIHWHGLEPTPMNDGVGHCSFEIGHYTYQWQPQFIGTYFAHCHRNTMQHFEFGLYFLIIIEPKDAYFATQQNPAIPIGHCRDGKRRTAANLTAFPQFPDFNASPVNSVDPWTGDPALKFNTNPHGHTVAYDIEALWVLDDRDSAWSDLADNARATYPQHGTRPGFNDHFDYNGENSPAQPGDFFAFNDFNADYWYVTGVAVEARKGGTATIAPNIVIPAALNSGVSGSQVSINGLTNQTILVRCLDAAYNSTEVTFPVDVVIIAWDGRALGVAPFGQNHPYLVPAGTPIKQTTARRFDALIRVTTPVNGHATVKFINNRGQVPGEAQDVLVTARIPITIGASFGIKAAAAANGSITLPGTTRVAAGGSQSYTITPNTGFRVSALVVDGVQLAGATSYTFTNVTANHFINAYFAPVPTFTLKAAAGANGTISPAGISTVNQGTSRTFTITPNNGYAVSALVVDGVTLAGANTYTFTNVTGNHFINAYFTLRPTFSIKSAAGANGSITPSGSTNVVQGNSRTYVITPNTGFRVSALVVDGATLPGAGTYTFSNVTAGHYINAYFAPAATYTVKGAAGANGTITPSGSTTVTSGGSLAFNITPNPGFRVVTLIVDGVTLPGANSYTFSNVTANHYVNAYFAPL
jgi:hypothetical protein